LLLQSRFQDQSQAHQSIMHLFLGFSTSVPIGLSHVLLFGSPRWIVTSLLLLKERKEIK
jgi:hypothetical protein